MSLRETIASLANTFAASVVAEIRRASLAEILDESATSRGAGRLPQALSPDVAIAAGAGATAAGRPSRRDRPKGAKEGRLARRTASDIEPIIGRIVTTLREHKAGLRSEQLQRVLKLSKKEITRPLTVALGGKKIRKTGEKRATIYHAA